MKEYSFGKKAAVVVIHQMFMVLMVISLFTMSYLVRLRYGQSGMVYGMLSIVGLLGTFISLAYLTNVTGKQSPEDDSVRFHWIDRLYTDVLAVLFALFLWWLAGISFKLRIQNFELAGLLVAAGTLAYLADFVFLLFYLSIIRRVKGNVLLERCLLYKVGECISGLFAREGNESVVQKSRKYREQKQILDALCAISDGAFDTKLDVSQYAGLSREMAEAVNHIGAGMHTAVTESIRNEQMKAELITNVSHDIKTPLTSIVNYVDLLKRENLDNSNARNYIRILDEKSQRLKQLAEDLVEASKISSGNVRLDMQKIDFVELLYQTGGEFNEKFEQRELTIVTKLPNREVMIYADGQQLYRTIANLYTNAAKYALEKTRVYVELATDDEKAVFTIKNISKNPIHLESGDSNDLTERFVRGEVSRTTEGSGLGLSIAKNLTLLMGGSFNVMADGDLFLVTLSFYVTGLT